MLEKFTDQGMKVLITFEFHIFVPLDLKPSSCWLIYNFFSCQRIESKQIRGSVFRDFLIGHYMARSGSI